MDAETSNFTQQSSTTPETTANAGTGTEPDWQSDFRRSGHPLTGAVGHVVALTAVRDVRPPAGLNYLFSRSTLDFLESASSVARELPEALDGSYRRVLDLDAALIELRARLDAGASSSYQYSSVLDRSYFGNGWGPSTSVERKKTDPDTVMLGPNMVVALALAAWAASEKPGELAPVTLDTFIFGLLAQAGAQADRLGRSLGASPSMTEAGALRDEVRERLPEMARALDRKHVLDFATRAPPGWAPLPGVSERPEYNSDAPIADPGADLLGFSEDARALAELLCLQDSGARAVGVFGDWGSGKSSLLNLVSSQIDALLAQKQPAILAEGRDQVAPDPFIGQVKHVRFNVWDYNDADLMLALANVTLRELRDYDALKELELTLDKELERLDADRASSEDLIKNAKDRHADATAQIHNASVEAGKTRDKARTAARKDFGDLLRKGGPGPKAASELLELAEGGRALFSTLSLARVRYLLAANWKYWAAALLLAGVLGWVGWQSGDGENGTAATLMGLLGLAAPFAQFVMALDTALRGYITEVGQAEREQAEAVADARRERDLAREEIALQTRLVEASRAKMESYAGEGNEPLWRYLLHESAEAREIEQSRGLTSRLKDVFTKIDKAIGDNRVNQAAAHKRAVPDRIIFYIDELDRCRARQVVRMLEAIHLLLAFDNFAVVVAVDRRWLVASLESVFADEMARNDGREKTVDQITAHEYIEKIIQVPLQVRSLAFEPAPEGGDTPSGSFVRLIDKLTSSDETREEADGDVSGVDRDGTGIAPLPIAIEDVMPQRTLRAAEERARLTEPEIKGLRRMGAVVGTSPRTVKRFVNLYRLVRALRTGEEFENFRDGGFAPVQLSLAIQTGMSALDAAHLRAWLEDSHRKKAPYIRGLSAAGAELLAPLTEDADARAALLQAWTETERFTFWNQPSVGTSETHIASSGV